METTPATTDEALSGSVSDAGPPFPTESSAGDPAHESAPVGEALLHSTRLVTSLVGSTIGPYRIERRLGGGAMASVFAATVTATGERVALKVLLPDADATVRERFRLEARTVAELVHPHIVRTLEVGGHGATDLPTGDGEAQADAPTFIAMELVEGESLGELLDRVRVLNATDAAALLAPVARALAYAHARNVVHRDVKPSNVLLRRAAAGSAHAVRLTVADDPLVPLLSDFGIARALDAPDLTSAGRTIGTPAYMSPEQCAGSREVTGRADIYSLGAVLYRALVGRSPFSGTTTQILYAHVYEPLTIPGELLHTLPPLLVEVLRRSMAKEPEDRYADVLAMAADLSVVAGRTLTDEFPVVVAAVGEPTATMLSVEPAVHGAGEGASAGRLPTSSVVLVAVKQRPAVAGEGSAALTSATLAASSTPQTPPPQPSVVQQSTFYVVPQVPEPVSTATSRPRRGLLVALAMLLPALLLLWVAVTALLGIGPFAEGEPGQPGSVTMITPAPQEMPAAGEVGTPAPSLSGAPDGAGVTPASSLEPAPQVGLSTPAAPMAEATLPAAGEAPLPTPAERPTPAGDIAGFWSEAQAFVDERDWGSALSWLTLVQRIDPTFEQVRVQQLLVDTLISLGAQANRRGDAALALQQLERAASLQPVNRPLANLVTATRAVAATGETSVDGVLVDGATEENALRLLQISHMSYSDAMVRANRVCDAADHMQAAERIYPESRVEALSADLARRCAVVEAARADQRLLESLPGRLLYSTQLSDGRYALFSVAPAPGSLPVRVLDDARQPALSSDGGRIAFYWTSEGEQGLYVATFDGATGLTGEPLRVGDGERDGADSPASWNRSATEVVYQGVDGADGRARLFRSGAEGENAPQSIAPGQAPAWNLGSDRIAFNGVDSAGRNAGLYLMRPDGGREGANDGALTDNGNDTRPVWTPDGAALLFMSSGRSQSWDLFRVTAGGAPEQLTTDLAQDGLAAVSPDGRYVAWMSDRGGRWNIWVRALEDDTTEGAPRELLLATVEGSLTSWLEHSLVWIP